jgi:hypothetical protein
MAEKQSGGFLGVAAYLVTAVASMAAGLWSAVTRDGTLAAAGRQGADEIGMALKAFPESIQTQESGSILNPTQGEIASSRDLSQSFHGATMRSPSQIAKDKGSYGNDATPGYEQAQAQKTPSEIARDKGPAEQQHGQEQQQNRANANSHGRE